jgi:hypothetical protein
MTKRSMTQKLVDCLCLGLLLVAGVAAYADTMFGVPAKVDEIDMKANSMKVTYTDPDSKQTVQKVVYWDTSTEFIKEGPPPDLKESPLKPTAITKGAKVYIVITDKGVKGGKLWLDKVRLKPLPSMATEIGK